MPVLLKLLEGRDLWSLGRRGDHCRLLGNASSEKQYGSPNPKTKNRMARPFIGPNLAPTQLEVERARAQPPGRPVPEISPALARLTIEHVLHGPTASQPASSSFSRLARLRAAVNTSASCEAFGLIEACAAAMRAFQEWFRCNVGIANIMACKVTSCSLSGKVSSQAMISGDVGSVTAPI
jgi:hypothetical protein